jgi:hypothetical protein
MSKNPYKRKCSAVCNDDQPCQAWAVIESEPALCSAHAGLNIGAGARKGNRNAVKHGLYMSGMKADEIAGMQLAKTSTLMDELVLVRLTLRRLWRYLENDDLAPKDVLAVVPILYTGARTVVYLQNHIGESSDGWDEVLDRLGAELGIDI